MLIAGSKMDFYRSYQALRLVRQLGFMILDALCMVVLLGFCALATFVAGI